MKINFDVSPYSMHSMSAVTAAPSPPPPPATKMMMYAKLPTVYISGSFLVNWTLHMCFLELASVTS